MKSFDLPYHRSWLTFNLPDNFSADVISEKEIPALINPEQTTEELLSRLRIDKLILNKKCDVLNVAIAVNDKTRPIPHQHILPPLLKWLNTIGTPISIVFFIASGTHQPLSAKEIQSVLPASISQNYPVVSHNSDVNDDMSYLGVTSRNTPVWINRRYYQADLKIVIGNIEPHHFMGYSGGVKSASIGLAARETITKNHNMLLLPEARAGNYENNPMRMDIEEIGRMIDIQLALNVILNSNKEIISVLVGEPSDVMKRGIAIVREQMMQKITHPYEIVICSAGGYPKDINLYQAQKALTHASYFAKDAGKIILTAACSEGLGSQSFETFINSKKSSQDILDYFKENDFEIGIHKALQIVKITQNQEVIVKSEINTKIPDYLLKTTENLQVTINQTLGAAGKSPRIAILPSATHLIPYFQ